MKNVLQNNNCDGQCSSILTNEPSMSSLAYRMSQLSTYSQSSSSTSIPAMKLKRMAMMRIMRKTWGHSCSSLNQRMAVLSQVEIWLDRNSTGRLQLVPGFENFEHCVLERRQCAFPAVAEHSHCAPILLHVCFLPYVCEVSVITSNI